MRLIDVDNSGSIEFDEFVKAMENWLSSDVKPDAEETVSGSRKRKKSNDDERLQVTSLFFFVFVFDSCYYLRNKKTTNNGKTLKIHKKVRSFFTQFQTSSAKLDAIRDEMRADQQQQQQQQLGGVVVDDMPQDFRLGGDSSSSQYTSQAKLEFLVKFRTTMESARS